jgi:hypothetical protein
MEFEKSLEVLEKIASEFPEGSDEYAAMELAAKAMHYVRHEDVGRRFQAFLKDFDAELTAEQKENLRRMGIDAGIDNLPDS